MSTLPFYQTEEGEGVCYLEQEFIVDLVDEADVGEVLGQRSVE